MDSQYISELILTYRYWILIPLSFIEGPVVSFLAGALVPLGYFRFAPVFIIFFVRDLIFDSLYYVIGHYGNRTQFVKRMLQRIGVTDDHLNGVRAIWTKHPFKTMFFGKLAYGIAVAFMLAAGIVRVPFRKFLTYSLVVAVIQYGAFITLGYFLGTTFSDIVQIILHDIAIVLFIGAVLVMGYAFISIRMKHRLLQEEAKATKEILNRSKTL
jgi:membrane protein DedA with SNARE-associated domain